MDMDALLADVKNYLNITWEDEATDKKLLGLIRGGVAYLDNKAGEAQDYSLPGYPRDLLMDYVRYARDGASDVFEGNYRHLILAMQHECILNRYKEGAAV